MCNPGVVRADANLYMYLTDKKNFENIALAWYKTSNKFDRNSYGRWLDDKFKTQLIRASIDNSIVFLPTRKPCETIAEETTDHPILICHKSDQGIRISAIGVILEYVDCPPELFDCKHLMMVHVVSTSMASATTLEELAGVDIDFEQVDYLPENVMKLSDDVSDKVDIGVENLTFLAEYEKHIVLAHAYEKYLNELLALETPVKKLENERKKRVLALKFHLVHKKKIQFPSARQEKFSMANVVKLYKKFTT